MPKRSRGDADRMQSWLIENGCPLDVSLDQPDTLPLQVRQGAPAESMIFRIAPGGTGFAVWVQLATEIARGVRIGDVELRLEAAPDIQFALLDPPERADAHCYVLPGGFPVQRDQVLNHCIPGNVYPNQPWEGFLLGLSMQALPTDFYRQVWAKLTIADDYREVGNVELHLVLDAHEHGRRKWDADHQAGQRSIAKRAQR
jgi:hypothetical protein